ncbi:Predicted exporter [Andreprevotia lacus DSM 23236]|jgi:predicted exporter|uniref:Predicted exporter n=1 Tax=Andreprevotia lacus DSM 23236 TaxID=1121001 RepID=A0A1W1X3U3_9NEIS|nr:MMPL family transporter [Andreprevotia lacus]SMC18575.1 Predicted exporter [Andreprevotia lacus DSM 23236]
MRTLTQSRLWHVLALLWLLVLLGATGWLVLQHKDWTQRLDTDLFALLPRGERDTVTEQAMAVLAKSAERQLIVLVGSKDRDHAAQAATQLAAALKPLPLDAQAQSLDLATLRDFYAQYRSSLLAPADLAQLGKAGQDALLQRALTGAYSGVAPGALPWRDDPFGTYGNWLTSLGERSPVRPEGGQLWVEHGGLHYAVLSYTVRGSAFSLDIQRTVAQGLEQAIAQIQAPDIKVLRAGVALHAAKAATQAEHEMSTIGVGSLLGIVLLVLLTFRGWRALPLVALSVFTGTVIALALTFLLYPRVHMLTLVFGCSLIGVAVDYSLLLHSTSLGARVSAGARLERLLPSLLLATVFTAVAYLSLMLTPFPGLAQIAVFAATGIASAWLSELIWYPRLAPAQLQAGWLGRPLLRLLARWPRLSTRQAWLALLIASPLLIGGLWQLERRDDIRALAALDAGLMQQQREVGDILALPSPAQLFVVDAADEQTLLARELQLTAALDQLKQQGRLQGYQAVSQWLLPLAEQQRRQALAAPLRATPLLIRLADEVGLPPAWITQQQQAGPLLAPATWLASPASLPARHLWLGHTPHGYASVVMLAGANGKDSLQALAALRLPGVHWVDKPAEISAVLGRYRDRLGLVLIAAYILTTLVLVLRYRRHAWRVLAPSLLASVATLALFGWLGIPLQLLTVLTLLLLLGMGMDYGIFVNEHPGEVRIRLAITLAAVCTLLSFGLLAFSHTPALSTFGIATLSGIGLAWLIAPLLRRPTPDAQLFTQEAPTP